MKRVLTFALALPTLAASLGLVGCGKNPTAPEPQAPAPDPIMTPTTASIDKIVITKFPAKTTSGDDWDISILVASRRPDLYVILTPVNGVADYVSNTVSNATTGTHYTFTQAESGALPAYIPYGTSRRVYVMDEDFGGDDDRLGWITVNLPLAYQGDNARNLDYTFTDSGNRLSVRVIGTWSY